MVCIIVIATVQHFAGVAANEFACTKYFGPFNIINFSNTPNVAKVFEQAVGPGVLQTFSTRAVKH